MPERLIHMLHTPFISAFFGALFATGVVIDEKTMIPIGTLACTFMLAFWIGRKLQRIDDRLDVITRQADRMEDAAIKVAQLPCMIEGKICNGFSEKPNHLKMKP